MTGCADQFNPDWIPSLHLRHEIKLAKQSENSQANHERGARLTKGENVKVIENKRTNKKLSCKTGSGL